MQSLYTNEVREFIQTRDWPAGLILQVEENYTQLDDNQFEPYLQVVFFRDNFSQFPSDAQQKIAFTMNAVMMKLRNDGIPIYLEVRAHAEG